jgi:probable rRNA maturation factor
MIYLQVSEAVTCPVKPQFLKNAAQTTLDHQAVFHPTPANLTIVLTDDEHIRTLNRDFLGIDAPTDVLAFPAEVTDPETQSLYLGDVLISLPRAQAQAKKHPLEAELQLLVVHGVLHLLGHDHTEEADKGRMWQAQREVLRKLGCEEVAPVV